MRVVWLQESHRAKVMFVIKKGHHMSRKRENTIPRTFEALCSLEMVWADFFPTEDILRISVSSLDLGRLLSLWEPSSIATFSGDEKDESSLRKTVDTVHRVRR